MLLKRPAQRQRQHRDESLLISVLLTPVLSFGPATDFHDIVGDHLYGVPLVRRRLHRRRAT